MIAVAREPNVTELRDRLFGIAPQGILDFRSGGHVITAGDVRFTWKPKAFIEVQQGESLCYRWDEQSGNIMLSKGSAKDLQSAVKVIESHHKSIKASQEKGF